MDPRQLAPFRSDPGRAGLFLDFDGTLSEIVADPGAARLVEGAERALADLAGRFALVAIVSGRSAQQLVEWVGPQIEIWGLHGAERARGGTVELTEVAAGHLPLMQRVLAEVRRQAGPDVLVEDKGVMIGLHYRAAGDRRAAKQEAERLAAEMAERYGVVLGTGRLVVELRPPVRFSKADVIARRARDLGLEAALFAGDDVVDLPAFDALDELARQGLATLRVAIDSDESPRELLARADVVVDGPSGLVRWLSGLV